MFKKIKKFCSKIVNRLRSMPTNDQGMVAGGIAGSSYAGLRALFTPAPLNIPLVGGTVLLSPPQRLILGVLVGGFVGSTFGNRYGQLIDRFRSQQTLPDGTVVETELNNQTFLMRTMPFAFAGLANYLVSIGMPGGNPIFNALDMLSTGEIYTLTTLNGLYVGGTVGYRGGRFIDIFTNNHLVADFGLFSGAKFLARKIQECRAPSPLPALS